MIHEIELLEAVKKHMLSLDPRKRKHFAEKLQDLIKKNEGIPF